MEAPRGPRVPDPVVLRAGVAGRVAENPLPGTGEQGGPAYPGRSQTASQGSAQGLAGKGDGSRAPNRAQGRGPRAREERGGEDDGATLFADTRGRKGASSKNGGAGALAGPAGPERHERNATQRRTATPNPEWGRGRMVGKQNG